MSIGVLAEYGWIVNCPVLAILADQFSLLPALIENESAVSVILLLELATLEPDFCPMVTLLPETLRWPKEIP